MRTRWSIILILVLSSLSVVAQPRLRTPEMYVGVHGGILANTVLFNPQMQGLELKYAPFTANGGLVFRYAGHKVCGIQVEVNYMQRAWREVVSSTTPIDYYRQLDYIEIPLLMHLYFGGERGRGLVNFGPQIGYCFRDVEKGTGQSYLTKCGPIKPFDYGLALGLGGYYRTKKAGIFQLELRGNFSLGGVFGTRQVDYFINANAINLSANLAYMWEFKIK